LGNPAKTKEEYRMSIQVAIENGSELTIEEFVSLVNSAKGVVVHYTEGRFVHQIQDVKLELTGNHLSLLGKYLEDGEEKKLDVSVSTKVISKTVKIGDFQPPIETEYDVQHFAHLRIPYVGANWFFQLA
jgi:isocitrate dehydrogenase